MQYISSTMGPGSASCHRLSRAGDNSPATQREAGGSPASTATAAGGRKETGEGCGALPAAHPRLALGGLWGTLCPPATAPFAGRGAWAAGRKQPRSSEPPLTLRRDAAPHCHHSIAFQQSLGTTRQSRHPMPTCTSPAQGCLGVSHLRSLGRLYILGALHDLGCTAQAALGTHK